MVIARSLQLQIYLICTLLRNLINIYFVKNTIHIAKAYSIKIQELLLNTRVLLAQWFKSGDAAGAMGWPPIAPLTSRLGLELSSELEAWVCVVAESSL